MPALGGDLGGERFWGGLDRDECETGRDEVITREALFP